MNSPLILRYLIFSVSLIELYAEFIHDSQLVFFTKPLVLPLIALYFFTSVKGSLTAVHKLMLAAFLFSWFGDIFLMLTPETAADTTIMGISKNKNYFLGGLTSFLVTQILFITSYSKSVTVASSPTPLKKLYYLPFFIFWIIMLAVILPPLQSNEEKQAATIPVIIYSGVLVSMAATALSRYGKTTAQSFRLTFIGACIFLISDSLIAINFLALSEPTYYAGFTIFSTYVIAEYLIAEGILKHN
ncbi:MAG: lysoplasmalogenase [Bacteroidia bacterium]